jgi:LPS-assembly protein
MVLAVAQVQAGAEVSEGLRLKLEKQLRLAPTRPERDSAKFLEADHIEGQQDHSIVATGNVTLRQLGATIRADRVDYSGETQTAVATGGVRLERFGVTATGPRLMYNLEAETGEMQAPVFEFPKTATRPTSSRGRAERAQFAEGQQHRLYKAEYTSCPVPRDDWFIRVADLEIDSLRNVGNAHHSTLFFLGLPILYSPYLSFPLDNKRKSGFLSPTFGTSGQSGFEAALPYYWNIAENYDDTITPKIFSKRGLQLGNEFRYLWPSFSGQIDGEYLPHDRIQGGDRWYASWRHTQTLGRGWSAALNAQGVSDDDYFRDLSTKIAATSQTNLPRDAAVSYNDAIWSFSARALGYQTLQDPLQPVTIPYNILPQLLGTGAAPLAGGVEWQFAGELSNFRHPTLVNGQRLILYPSFDMPLRRGYGYVTPKVGFHYTRYNLDGNNTTGLADAITRGLPITSLDAGLFFERETSLFSRAFEQTLEPRLYYLYIPFKDQTGLPNFTTAESDFNFQRFFMENRFVGGDRIGDANQLTLAMTSRLVESSTGLERLSVGLGQVYYFEAPRVTLSGAIPPEAKTSDILGFAQSRLSSAVNLDFVWQYTPTLSRSEKITVAARYAPEPGKVINAAYRYVRGEPDPTDLSREGIEQVDLSAQWPITRNLSGLARWNWSTKDRKLLEGLVGFEYNAGCWQVRAVAHRFITATQQYSTSFQIQLELTGLSRIGISPLETIKQNIGGYRRPDEIAP